MSKVILKIGYSAWLLPSDRGVSSIINALRGAVRITASEYLGEGCTQWTLGEEDVITVLPIGKKHRFVVKDGIAVDVTERGAKAKPAKALPPRRPAALSAQQTLALEGRR